MLMNIEKMCVKKYEYNKSMKYTEKLTILKEEE